MKLHRISIFFSLLITGLVTSLVTGLAASATDDTLAPLDLSGKNNQEKARAIAEYAEEYHGGWKSSRSQGRMVFRDAAGNESEKALDTYAAEASGRKNDGGRSFIIYDPKGTALLTHMKRDRDDSQWVWIPGLKRKMRVKASNVTGSFIGSEFAIEDLRSQYPEKFDLDLLREEACGEYQCWVIERKPRFAETGYSRQVVWFEQQDYRVMRTDFYDRKGDLLKTMTPSEWRRLDSGDWRAYRNEMLNHQTKRSSAMVADEIEVDIGMEAGAFDVGRGLMR